MIQTVLLKSLQDDRYIPAEDGLGLMLPLVVKKVFMFVVVILDVWI